MIVRYLGRLHPLARRELAGWHSRALRIPDPTLRRQAVATLIGERSNAEGAALFAVLAPPAWAPILVHASVAFQVMYDYLDTLTEPAVPSHSADCALLHRAIIEALDPSANRTDWYAMHPSRNDGGYLQDLVAACRSVCSDLPSFRSIAQYLRRSAERAAQVQTLTHCNPNDAGALRDWATPMATQDPALSWFEHAAGASSTLDIHSLIALAADPDITPARAAATTPHLTTLCALNTLLESLVDLPEDISTGDHSYISHYANPYAAADRMRHLAVRCACTASSMPHPFRHLAIVTAMASLYLSRREAWEANARPIARATLAELRPGMWLLIVIQRLLPLVPRG